MALTKVTSEYDGYKHCAVGAMEVAALELGLTVQERGFAQYALSESLGSLSITGWNDANGRTEDEVREAMLIAAKDLRNSVKE